MPKMKTHSGSKKRFRRSGTGKIMRAKAYKSHILTKKSTKRKRGFRRRRQGHQRPPRRPLIRIYRCNLI